MNRILLTVAAIFFLQKNLAAQVVLNEVCPSNLQKIADEDGDHPDWIEIFNNGFDLENLENFSISDDATEPEKWKFPALSLAPGERMLIFASGKNRKNLTAGTPHHWETAVAEGDDWQYFVGTSAPSSKWNYLSFNALANWETAPGPFGYGDDDDATTCPAGTLSFYFRKNFEIADASKLTRAQLSIDYDDAFVAYLNGLEIARSENLPATVDFQTLATFDREAEMYAGGSPRFFNINPAALAAALKNGENVLAIELHNVDPGSSDLTGRAWLHFGVSDDSNFFGNANPSWFSAADERPELHTNFKISTAEKIKLFDADGRLLDSIALEKLQPGHARARISDGDEWCFSDKPTPGEPNEGVCYKGYAPTPKFSLQSGFYTGNQQVAITGATNIHFSTDGNLPNDSTNFYAAPVQFSKSGVLRAQSFQAQRLPSEVVTASIFVDEPTTLPVVSITVPPRNFFDDGTGGAAIYDSKTGKTAVRVEYFDAIRLPVFAENASARVVGNYSVDFPQKSLQFEFDKDFGATTTEVPNIFQKDKPKIKNLHGFRLRNMDDDAEGARMRDIASNRAAASTHCVTTGYDNVAVFINGEYWGHFAAREMMNKWFVRDNFGSDPDAVDIITTQYAAPNPYMASEGSDAEFFKMSDFIIQNPVVSTANWLRADSLIDWKNWVDYFFSEIYIQNGDWFSSVYFNNTRLFRAPGEKWKFILWDTNYSQTDPWGNLLDESLNNPANPNRYTDMMNRLLQNTTFRNYFINRFADLLNENFKLANLHKIIDENAAQLAPEIDRHNARWGGGNLSNWQGDVELLKNFHIERRPILLDQIEEHFDLAGQVNITLESQPAGYGFIQISSITPTELPWTGTYFKGVPVKITAVPKPGCFFSNWMTNPNIPGTSGSSFTANLSADTKFTAVFAGFPFSNTKLVVSELNFHSDSLLNSGDWIELFNATGASINLSGWTLEDESLNGKYTFPTGTTIAAGARLVLFEDAAKFTAIHPTVTNKLGPLPFALSNTGERLILKDLAQTVVVDFTFKDGPKWQCTADGLGRTLELISPDSDPNEPESWFAGCIGGSPGKAYSACADLPTISEINYNSAVSTDAGDWFEIYNPNAAALNLGGWRVRDSDDKNLYTVPAGTSVAAGGRLVFFGDAAKFTAQHPSVSNKIGPLTFGLAASGDALRLYDASGRLQNSVCYLDTLPWPLAADGGGKTLEFKIGQSPTNPGSWFAGCPGGSPGKAFTPSDCGFISTGDFSVEKLKLDISPNPAEDFVYVKILGDEAVQKFDLKIFDTAGRLVLARSGVENGGRLGVELLPKGVFQLVIWTEGRLVAGRFVILN